MQRSRRAFSLYRFLSLLCALSLAHSLAPDPAYGSPGAAIWQSDLAVPPPKPRGTDWPAGTAAHAYQIAPEPTGSLTVEAVETAAASTPTPSSTATSTRLPIPAPDTRPNHDRRRHADCLVNANVQLSPATEIVSQAEATNWTNYRFSVDIKKGLAEATPAVLFRWQSQDTSYRVQLVGSEVWLRKRSGGADTILSTVDTGQTWSAGQSIRLGVEGSGGHLRVLADGVPYLDYTDAAGPITYGKVGLLGADGTTYDNALVESLVAGAATIFCDANGNMASGNGRTIDWDLENRPTSITYQGQTTSFVYDGDGRRVKKTTERRLLHTRCFQGRTARNNGDAWTVGRPRLDWATAC